MANFVRRYSRPLSAAGFFLILMIIFLALNPQVFLNPLVYAAVFQSLPVTIFLVVPLVFVINGLTKGDWLQALLFAVAVAVGLTPEMLPMIVTVNLAKGAMAMSAKKVVVKRLNAIQNFGAMDILCTDKTGTLTQDLIILKRHLDVRGGDSDRVLEYATSTASTSRASRTCSMSRS